MLRTRDFKYVRRLYEKDEFYDLTLGESINLIDDERYTDEIKWAENKLLDWYMATCDVVPNRIDSRLSLDLIKNSIRSVKLPGSLIGGALGLYLRIRKQGPNEFLKSLQNIGKKK